MGIQQAWLGRGWSAGRWLRLALVGLGLSIGAMGGRAGQTEFEDYSLGPPAVGSSRLRVVKPDLLELTLVTSKRSASAALDAWDFVDSQGHARLPAPGGFVVTSGGRKIEVASVGFKREVAYAPLKTRDLRIGNHLFLQLAAGISENEKVAVQNPGGTLWKPDTVFDCVASPLRWSPAIHVNQTGYMLRFPRKAMVGYYAGTFGEVDFQGAGSSAEPGFRLVRADSGEEVFRGPLKSRVDRGFPYPCYQKVLEADFSAWREPGQYRIAIPGVGASYPFRVDDSVAGAFARAYALGIYHQRCGAANSLPFTRFTHGECHIAAAEVPTSAPKFKAVNESLAKETANFKDTPRHTAPQLKNVDACLYPFVNPGPVDVRGGHHDAGDYSKYTINSASFIHQLVFAADVFPGVGSLDNLGIPESGDGKSDIVQEAKWEADFLAKMQDSDGGFYFLVYPRDRSYEDNVTPDHGDPQVVFPKTTSVTAAATAALAQCASSPEFKRQFPEASARYLAGARRGWAFLERAIARFGKDGSYQKITHYGNDFGHDDELAWAACELFLATGEAGFHARLHEWLKPADPGIRKWSWWRLYDAYGCAIRSYAFAVKAGKLRREQVDAQLARQCEQEIAAAGDDQLRRSLESAYGTSFPEETKRVRAGGWYFSGDASFDLAVACQLDYPAAQDPRPRFVEAIIANLNYEEGGNPPNVSFVTGLGCRRQREIVHQYAQNDRRVLPPSGIPLGNVAAAFSWVGLYGKELNSLAFPTGDDKTAPYPIYDRWADAFNLTQEFVIPNQARGLAYTAWLMAMTPLKTQSWTSAAGQISSAGEKGMVMAAAGVDLSSAVTLWEAEGHEPVFGNFAGTNLLYPSPAGRLGEPSLPPRRVETGRLGEPSLPSEPSLPPQWIEAESQLVDGRRVFAATNSGFLKSSSRPFQEGEPRLRNMPKR